MIAHFLSHSDPTVYSSHLAFPCLFLPFLMLKEIKIRQHQAGLNTVAVKSVACMEGKTRGKVGYAAF